jgi:hypothetical protein
LYCCPKIILTTWGKKAVITQAIKKINIKDRRFTSNIGGFSGKMLYQRSKKRDSIRCDNKKTPCRMAERCSNMERNGLLNQDFLRADICRVIEKVITVIFVANNQCIFPFVMHSCICRTIIIAVIIYNKILPLFIG